MQNQAGGPIVPNVFQLDPHAVIRIPVDTTRDTLYLKWTQVVANANNINNILDFLFCGKETFLKLEDTTKEVRLQVNGWKTKTMAQTRKQMSARHNITIGDYNVVNVYNFKNLGTKLSNDP